MKIYIKAEVSALTDHRFLAAGPEAFAVFFRGLMYSKIHLTDGFVPDGAIGLVTFGVANQEQVIANLVKEDLWEKVEGGYTVGEDNWAEHQTTREEVEQMREAAAERQRKSRERHKNVTRVSQRDNSDGHSVTVTPVTPQQSQRTESETENKKEKVKKETPPLKAESESIFSFLASRLRSPETETVWADWLECRTKKGFQPYEPPELRSMAEEYDRFDGPESFANAIRSTLANGYRRVFPPKPSKSKNSTYHVELEPNADPRKPAEMIEVPSGSSDEEIAKIRENEQQRRRAS